MEMERLRLSGGTELAYATAGETSRPAVLLLHGTPNSARMFRELMPALAQSAYVIAPDLPGFRLENPRAKPEQIRKIAAAIKLAKRPINYAGGGIISGEASE